MIPKIPEKYCDGAIGPDGIPMHFKKGHKDYGRYKDVLCTVQYPNIKLTSVIGFHTPDIYYHPKYPMHEMNVETLKASLYAAKHDILALQFWISANKISLKEGKVNLTKTYVPSNLIVFYKQNIDYAILKFLMYDDRYKNKIDMYPHTFYYVDGLTYGYSDENIRGWYLRDYLQHKGIKKYGKDKWFDKGAKVWMRNMTKLRKQLEKSGELDEFDQRINGIKKAAKKFIKDTFKSKKFKALKKEIKAMIVPISELVPKIRCDEEDKKDLLKWLNSLTK